jgi:nucleoside-diphosphate-sugar epimerase
MDSNSNIKSLLILGVGFVGGWTARSLADSPQGVGVKLLEIAMNAKERIGQWAAVEGERLEDMLAEARAKVETDKPDAVTNGAAHEAPTATGEA